MADIIDDANAQADLALGLLLTVRRPVLAPTGACHNCDALLGAEQPLFCDADCARDHERRADARVRNGR